MVAADILWRQAEQRLVIAMLRLDWEETLAGETVAAPPDFGAALRPRPVLPLARDRSGGAASLPVLDCLAVEFHPGKKPPAAPSLLFANGGVLRLEVECLECELADLGPDNLDTDLGGGAQSASGAQTFATNPIRVDARGFSAAFMPLTVIVRASGKPPCRSVSTAAAPISPNDLRSSSPPSARSRPMWRRQLAPSSTMSPRVAMPLVIEATRKFDRLELDAGALRVTAAEIDAAVKACDVATLDALKLRARPDRGVSPAAAAEGRAFHRCARRRTRPSLDGDRSGRPLRAGRARRLSVLGADECLAGQGRRRAAHRDGGAGPGRRSIRWCWRRLTSAGVSEIYRIGGAQAVAALAYGTATIAPVAKIVGPGNAYVAAAKRQVFGKVGIDMIAGPSEVLVIADGTGNPDWIAADLLAQAEHDANAQSILITDRRDAGGRGRARCRSAIDHAAAWRNRACLLERFRRDHSGQVARRIRRACRCPSPPSIWKS